MSDYKDIIIDHYKNPRNFGELDNADISMDEANASCGDMIQIQVKMGNGMIEEMRWRGVGCAISTAAASMLSEKIVGMNKADLEKFGEAGIIEMLGGEVNAGRMKCATLAYRGLLKIFNNE
ncbi:MAG: SUF system FeS assembly protein, NifU family [Candidatus Collierbacteria bacterium GW2011_GWB1_44_6]|uniref:SUF system FeS assembly protein, NifU family n=2 Tax=Candidatus Collieribacteriota TaxID=1752725 RepID=A0A0G1MLT8_9BACT|nr:MAG: SUF system FeS assembly protein, NifU family [Candidatus Collierbacteria bacterium GW2011_GWC2_43_12]KKT72989.1 MAG: SUF system FeS assembly protein, NifU family [Candidatus Collierbacteria bacterium GW2011_GWB1_44_6]